MVIEYSFPYMHDGRMSKLKEVLAHYANSSNWQKPVSNNLLQKKISMKINEQKDLLSFLKTLSDKQFLFNEAFRFSGN